MRFCPPARSAFFFIPILALVITFAPVIVEPASAQVDAGYLADWKDCEVRVQDVAQTSEVSATLALVPPVGAEGRPPLVLVFEARWPRGGGQGVTLLEARAYLAPLADLRMHNRPVDLRFDLESGTGRRVPLYFYGSNWGTFGWIAAGDVIPVVRFAMTPSDLRALVAAEGITGEAMGFTFPLVQAQLEALRQFSRIAGLDDARSPD